jgi:hypothetical protein
MQRILMLLMVLWSVPSVACAGLPCIGGQFKGKSSALVQPVGIFGDPDRRTEEQFAHENGIPLAEVQAHYAATGILTCGQRELTANLVLVNDLIVTSAHGFLSVKLALENLSLRVVGSP